MNDRDRITAHVLRESRRYRGPDLVGTDKLGLEANVTELDR